MGTNQPLISVIIPVYNAAKTLNQCVDALVYQTFDNIEILIMEKKSTDNSLEIAKRFEKEFPNKVRVIELPYTENPARAINEGVKAAKGEYLCFNDPDDYFNLDAMQLIADKIMEDPFEMAFFEANIVDSTGAVLRGTRLALPLSKTNLLTNIDYMTYWRTCISRKFFLTQPPVIETCKYADITWIPLFITNARRIEYIPVRLYNYLANNGFTAANKISNTSSLEILEGFDYLLENADKLYYNEIVMFIISRFVPMAKNWNHKPYYIAWAQKHKDTLLGNKYLDSHQIHKVFLEKSFEKYNADHIPYIAYVDGFDPHFTEEFAEYVRQNAFIKGEGKVIVLNRDNCDISLLPCAREALDAGRPDYVAHFFALKNIYETGGCFVGRHIRFTAQLNSSCEFDSFFAFRDNQSFNDEIFGGHKESVEIKSLLDTYSVSDFFADTMLPLADRIRIVFSSTIPKLKINGRDALADDKIRFYSVESMTLGAGLSQEICRMDYVDVVTAEGAVPDDYIIVPKTVFHSAELSVSATGTDRKLANELAELQRKLNQIENSDSYKTAKRLSRFGNTKLGAPFKRVFKWLLKKYRKKKYGIG